MPLETHFPPCLPTSNYCPEVLYSFIHDFVLLVFNHVKHITHYLHTFILYRNKVLL